MRWFSHEQSALVRRSMRDGQLLSAGFHRRDSDQYNAALSRSYLCLSAVTKNHRPKTNDHRHRRFIESVTIYNASVTVARLPFNVAACLAHVPATSNATDRPTEESWQTIKAIRVRAFCQWKNSVTYLEGQGARSPQIVDTVRPCKCPPLLDQNPKAWTVDLLSPWTTANLR